jgi:hypothetical protein
VTGDGEYYRSILYINKKSIRKLTKICSKKRGEGGGWLRKSKIDRVNLIKISYMYVTNTTVKPLFTINLL